MSNQVDLELWADWSKHYQRIGIDPDLICEDGPLDAKAYDLARVRVLFALKEVHGSSGFSLVDYLQGGPTRKGQMWHAVSRWAAGIHNGFPPYSEINTNANKRDALRAVRNHNRSSDRKIGLVACPGLGTTTGQMTCEEAARQMALAYSNFLNPPERISWDYAQERQVNIRFGGDVVPYKG